MRSVLLFAAVTVLASLALPTEAAAQVKTVQAAVPRAIGDNVGVVQIPTTHWINTSRGIRICPDRQGFFAGSLGSEQKRVDHCTRPMSISQYVTVVGGRGAYATDIDRLAQGQLTIEYIIALPR